MCLATTLSGDRGLPLKSNQLSTAFACGCLQEKSAVTSVSQGTKLQLSPPFAPTAFGDERNMHDHFSVLIYKQAILNGKRQGYLNLNGMRLGYLRPYIRACPLWSSEWAFCPLPPEVRGVTVRCKAVVRKFLAPEHTF